jgi:hypothetical protein
MKYYIHNIEYVTDGELVDLPTEMEIIVPDRLKNEEEIKEYLSDNISNLTGFLHLGFSYHRIIPNEKIILNDLKELPCDKFYEYIVQNYGKNKSFNPLIVIIRLGGGAAKLAWLIANSTKHQTWDMIRYFKSFNPKENAIHWLIKNCDFCKRPDIFNYLKDIK